MNLLDLESWIELSINEFTIFRSGRTSRRASVSKSVRQHVEISYSIVLFEGINTSINPGWLHDDQGWPQDDSRMTLDDPRMTPGWPRISPGWPRMTKEDLRMTKDDPRMTPGWPQDDPGMTQYDSRMTQNNSRMTQAPAQAPTPALSPHLLEMKLVEARFFFSLLLFPSTTNTFSIFVLYKKIQKVPNRNSEIAKYCAIWWN